MNRTWLFNVIFICFFAVNSKPLAQKFRIGIDAYGTHFPVLATVVAFTEGPILELGSGDYSTPMLHALCAPTKRKLVSTDSSKAWLNLFLDLEREWHTLIYVPVFANDREGSPNPNLASWTQIGNDEHWSIVFVDHVPALQHQADIKRLRNNTDIFVVHDTENPAYQFEPVFNTFKYKYVCERYDRCTTVISDTIDITKFFES